VVAVEIVIKMEKIISSTPIRSRKLQSPIVFAANISLTYYNAMGMAFYT
jgi:hypothetical protein